MRLPCQRAAAMNVETVKPSHRSENLNWELWLRDPEGNMVVLTSPLPGLTQSVPPEQENRQP